MTSDFCASLDQHQAAWSMHLYPGVGHGFHSDTSEARSDVAPATLVRGCTTALFDHWVNG